MTIKPIGNRVVVKLVKQKKTSNSGIIISNEEKNEQAMGVVVKIGAGIGPDNVGNLGLQEKDTVIFGKYSGEEVVDSVDSETVYKILDAKDIYAVIVND